LEAESERTFIEAPSVRHQDKAFKATGAGNENPQQTNLTSNIIRTTLFRFVMKNNGGLTALTFVMEAVLPRAHMRKTPLDYKENFSESRAQPCLYKEPQQST
jgi:hypothetical protein